MAELNAIDKFLYDQLAGDSALTDVVGQRIYGEMAPDEAAFPYVVYQFLTGNDLAVINGTRIWSNCTYMVKAIDEAQSYEGDLKTAAGRIDAVLHKQSGSNANGTVYSSVREQPYRMLEPDQGRQFRHLGGIYRILAS